MTILQRIEHELARLGMDSGTGDGSLDAFPTDDPAFVQLQDTQERTVFEAQGLLEALLACPADATLDDVWQAIGPYRADA